MVLVTFEYFVKFFLGGGYFSLCPLNLFMGPFEFSLRLFVINILCDNKENTLPSNNNRDPE